MTIADLVQRGNPTEDEEDGKWGTDWEEDTVPINQGIPKQNGEISQGVKHKTASESIQPLPKNVVIIVILLLSATASFGLGYLAGRQGTQAGGLITSSVPGSSRSALDTASLTASGVSSIGTSTIETNGAVQK